MDQINSQIPSLSSLRRDGDIIFSTMSLPSMQTERQIAERLLATDMDRALEWDMGRALEWLQNPDEINWDLLSGNSSDRALEWLEQNPDEINWDLLSGKSNKNNNLTENLTAKKPVNQPLKNVSNRDS